MGEIGFNYDDAAIAIASVWEGLKVKGINYAFGNPDLFWSARQRELSNVTSVGAPYPLIMPLVFSDAIKDPQPEEEKDMKPAPAKRSLEQMTKEEKEIVEADKVPTKGRLQGPGGARPKGDTGPKHFVLAIAQRHASDTIGVSMRYMNSASSPPQGVTRAAARNIVRNSSWMPDGAWPTFSHEVWQAVPQQTNDAAGGTHMVMNAWAYMLNLTINETWSISSEEKSNFYKESRTVINLALQGHMNGDTILSFLTAYGYAHSQDTSQFQQLSRSMQCVSMNHAILGDIIQRMSKEQEIEVGTTADAPAPGPITTAKPSGKGPPGAKKPTLILKPPARPRRKPFGPFHVEGKTDWTDRLQQSLNACEAKHAKLGKTKLHTVRREQLMDEDVILAIAAVWRALWLDGIQFAFGTADLFQLSRDPPAGAWHGMASVGAPSNFIMPLLFNPDVRSKRKGKIGAKRSLAGHFLLAIAKRDSDDSKDVNIQIQDSAAGPRPRERTQQAAQNIVRYSGWMGLTPDGAPADVQPTFTEDTVTVPQQTGSVECGFHVIFNAWAHMLGLPVLNASARDGTLPDDDFYACGVRIVNLALSGSLDSATIQAFFNHFGYCAPQDPADAVYEMRSAKMSNVILNDIIGEIRDEEIAVAAARDPAQGPTEDDEIHSEAASSG